MQWTNTTKHCVRRCCTISIITPLNPGKIQHLLTQYHILSIDIQQIVHTRIKCSLFMNENGIGTGSHVVVQVKHGLQRFLVDMAATEVKHGLYRILVVMVATESLSFLYDKPSQEQRFSDFGCLHRLTSISKLRPPQRVDQCLKGYFLMRQSNMEVYNIALTNNR